MNGQQPATAAGEFYVSDAPTAKVAARMQEIVPRVNFNLRERR